MNSYIARQSRLGFGTVAMLTQTRPKDVREASAKVIAELEKMVKEEEKRPEEVIGVCLRLNLDELKRLVALEPTEKNLGLIQAVCDNVMLSFVAIG